MKHVLDFLRLKAETLLVNILKGYVTAISRKHTTVRGVSLSLGDESKVLNTPKAFVA